MKTNAARYLAVSTALCCLIACSHKNSAGSTSAPAPTPQRGDLVSAPMKAQSYATGDLLALVGGNDLGKTLLQLTVSPVCTIDVYHMEYQTVDPAGNLTPASGALMVPSGAASCEGGRAIVLYAHGTNTDRNFNIADLTTSENGE